jgi:YidC/Oxa1 family membrane protein insertase
LRNHFVDAGPMMDIQRLIAFVVFSASSLLLWDAWQKHTAPKVLPAQNAQVSVAGKEAVPKPSAALSPAAMPAQASSSTPAAPPGAPIEGSGKPVTVKTDLFEVELNTVGGDIQRVTLNNVFSALDRNKPLTLLSPDPKQNSFVTQSGLIGDGLPFHKSVYVAESESYDLADGRDQVEVRLVAKDVVGAEVVKKLIFRRGSYEVLVSYEITNTGEKAISPLAYFQFRRDGNQPSQEAAQTSSMAGVATFTGPAVYTEESKFVKVDFKDIDKGKQSHPKKARDGWIGFIQHYFVSAWLPKGDGEREFSTDKDGDQYRISVKVPVGAIAAGGSAAVSMPLYIGPQETENLKRIAPGLELVVDYGWLHIIAAPLFWVLKFIHGLVGNWGWSIIILTILIKLVFYPLNHKAGRSMAQMKVLAPKMEKLKQLYGDDRQKLNQAMMELYRTEKINPLGGCLPIVVQIPVFIALYWVLLASIELRHAPWLGWIQDLSAPDPLYILPVVYAVSMFVQTKLNPQPADPVQAKVMLAMPIVFSIFFFFFPSGLVLYWVVQNLLSILQQWNINRTLAAEAALKAKGKR